MRWTRRSWHLGSEERALLHADHAGMLAAFCSRDAEALTAVFGEHHHRLQTAIGALPHDTGLFEPDQAGSGTPSGRSGSGSGTGSTGAGGSVSGVSGESSPGSSGIGAPGSSGG